MRIARRTLVLLAATALATAAFGDDRKPAPSAAQDAEMKAWMEASTPGPAHKRLEVMAGSFAAHVKMWREPGAPAQESDASAEYGWILGGRWLEEKFRGSAMGQTFEGTGWIGYDNLQKRYVSTWIDNMSTALMVATGDWDASGKVLTMTSTMIDPVTRRTLDVKSVTTVRDADHVLFEMWGPGPAGKPFKNLEIAYTRKK